MLIVVFQVAPWIGLIAKSERLPTWQRLGSQAAGVGPAAAGSFSDKSCLDGRCRTARKIASANVGPTCGAREPANRGGRCAR